MLLAGTRVKTQTSKEMKYEVNRGVMLHKYHIYREFKVDTFFICFAPSSLFFIDSLHKFSFVLNMVLKYYEYLYQS